MIKKIKEIKFADKHSLQIEVVELSSLINNNSDIIYFPHRTEFYHIFLFQDCNPTHIIDFNPVKVNPYSLLFINKNNVHLFDKNTVYKGKVLVFTDGFFCKAESDRKFLQGSILFNDQLSSSTIRLKKSNKVFVNVYSLIEIELRTETDGNQYDILKNLLHNLLLMAERLKRKQGFIELKKGADFDYTILFKNLLDQKFQELKSVNAYAKLLNFSGKRLNQATTKVLGKTPKQMIDDRVLLEAKRLLIHTNQSIKEIGFSMGFEDPSYFVKYFHKHVFITPIGFRNTYIR